MDVDTGIDDALALVYLLSRPEVHLQAITCTAGNVGARQVALNNLALLELCGLQGVE
ncbi:MAG TPA: nucleoside hydrolase, partial [Arthrobacter sp.]|nr:nucleoside hydrolase [Arthrobacter sp.]